MTVQDPNIGDPILPVLRQLRQQRGLSLDQIRKATNGEFKGGMVGAWERGHRNPPLTKLRALLNHYGYDLAVVRRSTLTGDN